MPILRIKVNARLYDFVVDVHNWWLWFIREVDLIIIPSQKEVEGGDLPVFIGVDGVGHTVARDKKTYVVKGVVSVLDNESVTQVIKDDDGELHPVTLHSYPFKVFYPWYQNFWSRVFMWGYVPRTGK